MNIKFYEVGGCIRDELLGIKSKDIDFTVVGTTFEGLRAYLEEQGFKIFQEDADHWTFRASVPKSHPLSSRTKVADFVLARKDGPSKDGRHPLWVKPGTLKDDLRRRDFTVNALARDPDTGEIIDHFGGKKDLESRTLRFVGDPFRRIDEDGLRVLRALRFKVTKGFSFDQMTFLALSSPVAIDRLKGIPTERIQAEVDKMFIHDTIKSLGVISNLNLDLQMAIFRDGLHLEASLKTKGKRRKT